MHGGNVPSGPAHPRWKHGRFSTQLAGLGIDRAFHEAMNDPELVSLRRMLAMTDARIEQVLEEIKIAKEAPNLLVSTEAIVAVHTQLVQRAAAVKAAQQSRDGAAMAEGIVALSGAITEADQRIGPMLDALTKAAIGTTKDVRSLTEEWYDLMERRRKLAESEGKTLARLHKALTSQQALALLYQVGDSIRTHVGDPAARRAVAQDLRRIEASTRPAGSEQRTTGDVIDAAFTELPPTDAPPVPAG